MSFTRETRKFLLLKLVNCEDVGGDHDDHGNVEGEEGTDDEEVLVAHLANVLSRHQVVQVDQS